MGRTSRTKLRDTSEETIEVGQARLRLDQDGGRPREPQGGAKSNAFTIRVANRSFRVLGAGWLSARQ